jgi:excisionase family DNA binding protein
MDQPTAKTALDSTPAFTLTVRQIDEIVQRAVQSALGQGIHPPPLLTPDELAAELKVPVSWVYEKSRQGEIPTHRIGRYPRFRLEEVVQSQQKMQPRS